MDPIAWGMNCSNTNRIESKLLLFVGRQFLLSFVVDLPWQKRHDAGLSSHLRKDDYGEADSPKLRYDVLGVPQTD